MTNKPGKYIFVTILLVCLSYISFAQVVRPFRRPPVIERSNRLNNPKPNRVQQAKLDYISKRLALLPEPTIKFERLYLLYMQDMHAVRLLQNINNSPAQANGADQVNKAMEYERELGDIKQRYYNEFLKIMPPEKVSVIFKSEQEFNREVLRISKENKPNGPSPVAPPTN